MKKTIAIIGAGNMGQAIANGVLRKKIVKKNQLFLTNSKTNNNKEVVEKAEIILLAVKPQMLPDVLLEIKDAVRKDHLIISIAAGKKLDYIQSMLLYSSREEQSDESRSSSRLADARSNSNLSVVRVMPNLAAAVGESMSVWFANEYVTTEQKKLVAEILSAIGVDLEVKNEEEIDKATAISGSGPAYFFYVIEQLEHAAAELGFSHEVARQLAKQTFIGAAETLKSSEKSAVELRKAVTSKGGTTEAAIAKFEKVKKSIYLAVKAAYKRAKELGK